MAVETEGKVIVLVTGGAGFIGSHVARHLVDAGHKVVVLDDLSGGFRDYVPKGAVFIEGSICDVDLVEDLFKKYKFTYVYHLAAYAAEGLSHFIKRFNYENNLMGSINLINSSIRHKVKCFVFTSSIAVYGENQTPMSEDMTPLPEDPYGVAKYAVELELKTSHEMFGLNYVIFRPHNVYGEHQNIGDRYRNVIGIFMNNLMSGDKIPIFGDGKQTRAFSYIDDVAPHIADSVFIPEVYNETFNIGADKPYTVLELAETVKEKMGTKDAEIVFLPKRNEVEHVHASHDKIRKVFDIQNTVSLDEGLDKMAAWAMKVGSRESKEFENVEIEENLPPSWKIQKRGQAKNKIVIYTAIFGPGKDKLLEPRTKLKGIDFVCFTDQDFTSKTWEIRKSKREYADPTRDARKRKILAHEYVSEYETSIWVDGNILVKKDPTKLVEEYLGQNNMAVFDKMNNVWDQGDCVYDELQHLLQLGKQRGVYKDDPDIMKAQIEKYRQEGYPEHNGMIISMIMLRKHNEPDVVETMKKWWSELERGSKRDQLSFNYSVWKTGLDLTWLPGDSRDNPHFKHTFHLEHRLPIWKRAIRKTKKVLGW